MSDRHPLSPRRSIRVSPARVRAQMLTVVALLTGLTAIGTIGLKLITQDESWIDCLYMAVITLTTVGFGETVQLNALGRIFIIGYLVVGLGVFTYGATQLGQWLVNARMRELLERRRMERTIAELKDHYIVCGLGRMGNIICAQLNERKLPFVVVDHDEERLEEICDSSGWLFVQGDATDDETLTTAGIERAKALSSVLPTDADNVYVVLSARLLNANLQIIARAGDEKAVQKMERAGATRVVSPFNTGAMKMARFMINPSIDDFLEIADNTGNELELADVLIDESCPYIGKQLMETDLRAKGVMVVGIRRESGERLMPPPGTAVIKPGDRMFAFGNTNAVTSIVKE